MRKRAIIIAEVGECWNGDVKQGEALIRAASEAGCDYVKFQTLDKETVHNDDPERDWFLKVALTDEMIGIFIEYARMFGIKPLFTPANLKKAKILRKQFDLTEVKIASSVLHDKETVLYIAKNYKRVFLSTGMSSLEELNNKIECFGEKRTELFILHCISEYPTGALLEEKGLVPLAEEDAHLNMMLMLKETFPKHKIGYSDHTAGLLAPICAVAAGAEVIEKHITLDKKKPIELYKSGKGYLGTDHILSLEPDELKEMVRKIRQVEKIFGDWKWQRTEGERKLRDFLVGRF